MKSFETRPLEGEEDTGAVADESQTAIPDTEREPDVPVQEGELIVLGERAAVSEDTPAYSEENLEEPYRIKRGFRFHPPTREQLLRWAPFWGVILLGAILRFWVLGDKPLHHDESLHAYYSWQLLLNMEHWTWCINPPASDPGYSCYAYNPLLHGPFQFHAIALVYRISQLLGAPDNGINTFTVRIPAATLGTLIVGLPYFLRDYIGKWGAWLACLMLAVSPSMVYFSRFAREDIYFAAFTLVMVVGIARYVRDRKIYWLVIAAAGFALAYATFEGIFLVIALFGGFLGALIVWELGVKLRLSLRQESESDSQGSENDVTSSKTMLPRTFAPVFVVVYFVIVGLIGKWLLGFVDALAKSIMTPAGTPKPEADQFVAHLKQTTVAIVPWLGIGLGVFVLILLFREMSGKLPPEGRRGLAKYVDPQKQPLLDSIVTMPWTHWFFALLCAWTIFLVLFTVLFTNVTNGIGDGIWQGLYYWIQQQHVARGSQPWYYYLMIIPLYEQVGLFFGVIGILRCIAKPTRFRLFLVYWFMGGLVIYSWAAEKMPWLTIHMTMPLMILAGIGLEPFVVKAVNFVKGFFTRRAEATRIASPNELPAGTGYAPNHGKVGIFGGALGIAGVIFAVLLLFPTVHNMYELAYVHPADGPHEMLVYVQTTTDVNIVMAKVDALDREFYGGKHQMPIALTADATWPFAWYVRDYTNVCFNFPGGCSGWTKANTPVIIGGSDPPNPFALESQYASTSSNGQPGAYTYHIYNMRTWWDEGYKPAPCIQTAKNPCTGDQSGDTGVGLPLWLSYGDNPPANATFNLKLAAQRIWNWEWNRVPLGSTGGAYQMILMIRTDLSKSVGP
ncbi:MAG TPA: flippase activity-associated protein Agl23 [Ktedonobacteraceae bacterium]|nr:flippase activity-associated protein Agl23 [Ktedonobacteraceae bacterium]